MIKELRGQTIFGLNCNTLYVGRRKARWTTLTAYENGFFAVFDRLQRDHLYRRAEGTDDVEVPVVGGELVQNTKIGRAPLDADVFISLSHFKGHEATGFGCLKHRRERQPGRQNGAAQLRQAVWTKATCVGCHAP